MQELIRLHIGGRPKADGWKIFDAFPGPNVDYVGSCTDLSFLPDESCSDVYSSHVIERLSYDGEIQTAMNGFFRILKPGGTLYVSVPDIDILCQLFLHSNATPKNRFEIMQMMFGRRTTPSDINHTGLSTEFLGGFIKHAGFEKIERVPSFGLFNDTSEMKYGGVAISLNVIGKKPLIR